MSVLNNFPERKEATLVTIYEMGLMSPQDKIKLDTIENSANNYIHPDNESERHVTDLEKAIWNAKESTDGSSSKAQQTLLQSKQYVDSIYQTMLTTISNATVGSSDVATDPTFLALVAKVESKQGQNVATSTVNGLFSKEDKFKLDNIEANANNYSHPLNHTADMITQDNLHRFVTDAQTSTWDAKADTTLATSLLDGLMSKELVKRLNSIAPNANNYSHPSSHTATMISEDSEHRFVNDLEKESWNGKADGNIVTILTAGLMSPNDKIKLNNVVQDNMKLCISKTNKDANKVYTITVYSREDGTVYKRVILSGGTSPLYATRTEEFYDINGTTLLKTNVYTLTYDDDGILIQEI